MRFATGDEVGLLRVVDVDVGTDTSRSAAESAGIQTYSHSARASYIQAMTVIQDYNGAEAIAVYRKGHRIELYDLQGNIIHDWQDHIAEEEDACVSIEAAHGILATCTASGRAMFRSLVQDLWYYQSLGGPSVSRLRIDPSPFRTLPACPGAIAVGGKENDLTIWQSMTSEGADPDDVDEYSMTVVWRAKNVKDDDLGLRVPVWVADIQFLEAPAEGWRVAVCTRYRHARIYDTSQSRRPVVSVEVGDSPLVSLILGKQGEFFLSDSHGKVFCLSMNTKKIVCQYKGATGAVVGLARIDNTLATVSTDRYLRAYDTETHELTAKVYLKTKMTSVVALKFSPPQPLENKDEEDVLEGLEELDNQSTKRRKIT